MRRDDEARGRLAAIAHFAQEATGDSQRLWLAGDFVAKSRGALQADVESYRSKLLRNLVPEEVRRAVDAVRGEEALRVEEADVAVVSVVEREWRAVRWVFEVPDDALPVRRGDDRYHVAKIPSKSWGRAVRVVLAMVGEPRNVPMARFLERMARWWTVKSYFLVGVAGGVKGKVGRGDVVVGELVIDYEGGKAVEGELLKRNQPGVPPQSVLTDWRQWFPPEARLPAEPVREVLGGLSREEFPDDFDLARFTPTVHLAAIASGEKVLVDGRLKTLRREYDDRIRAVDQESYAFGTTCPGLRPTPEWLVFRGVSDWGEPEVPGDREVKGDDRWQTVAAVAASVHARRFIEYGLSPGQGVSF